MPQSKAFSKEIEDLIEPSSEEDFSQPLKAHVDAAAISARDIGMSLKTNEIMRTNQSEKLAEPKGLQNKDYLAHREGISHYAFVGSDRVMDLGEELSGIVVESNMVGELIENKTINVDGEMHTLKTYPQDVVV